MISYPNCKINLGLHVVRRRDDGYHDLQTVFYPVPLCDELVIVPAEKFSFSQTGIAVDCNAEDNIVVKAFRLMKLENGNRLPDVEIRLDKRIPFGAGLGGGSSDAAFTLRMLNDLFNLGMDNSRLRSLASRLGADCPFFIDNEPSYATGIGDILSPLGFNPLKNHRLVVVKPDESVSTAEAYRGISPRESTGLTCPDLLSLLREPVECWRNTIVNDFETTVFKGHPLLSRIKEKLYEEGALYAAMSGSGSAVYGIFEPNAVTDLKFGSTYYSFDI